MADIISWNKAIAKNVKSSDDKDIGKIQSITKDCIQTKEVLVSKNFYFIPKYYIQGYDGDNLWISLTKDEVQSRFERDKEPRVTEFETYEYMHRKTKVTKQYPDFDRGIPVINAPNDPPRGSGIKYKKAKRRPSRPPAPAPAPAPNDPPRGGRYEQGVAEANK